MKHSMMRVAVAATLGLSALAANAGTLAVNIGSTLAAEYVTATTTVNQPSLTFATANLLVANTAVTFHIRTLAGTVATLPAPADISVAGVAAAGIGAPALDADAKGYYFTVTAPSTGLPAGTTVSVVKGATTLTGLGSALAGGGSVSASVGYTSTAGDFAGVTTWIESPISAVILNSASALSEKVTSSANFATAETKVVDVTVTPTPMTAFKTINTVANATAAASAQLINVGSVALKVSTAVKTPSGGTPAVADFGAVTVAATGDFTVGTATLTSDAGCTTAIAGVTTTVSTDKKTVTFSGIPVASIAALDTAAAVPAYVCYTTTIGKQIPFPVQYAIGSASLVAATAGAVASVPTGGNAYLLGSNGASVVVPSFVPSTGTAGNGYNTYLRVINTGSSTADISVSAYNSATGVAGAASKLVSQLPVNGSAMLDTNTVANALGLAANTWNTLVVSGPTSGLAVQPLLVNPQGVITNLSAVNGYTSNVGGAKGSN